MKKDYSIDRTDRRVYPMGATPVAGGMHFSFVTKGTACALLLYAKNGKKPGHRIPFPEENVMGDVRYMTVLGSFDDLEYCFEEDGAQIPDPYGRCFTGRERWGDKAHLKSVLKTPFGPETDDFDWEGDKLPCLPGEDTILYHLHTRGFTKHASSGIAPSFRGTFKAVAEKIPYLKELGITSVEMMPPVEFQEFVIQEQAFGSPFAPEEPEGKLDYWGYRPGLSFAPKASYGAARGQLLVTEFKNLVKALHQAGLELILELYFNGKESPAYALDVVRFWAREYHIDGVHLVGFAPLKLLAEDPYLSKLKLLAEGWQDVKAEENRRLLEYNTGFMFDMRSLLKGDEGQLRQLSHHIRHNPSAVGTVNFMANVNGFTLMDMVSYDEKHNEENGEENRDGTAYNQSWNCGVEGPTRRKKILQLRRKQLRNAMLLLFLSQGTPLLLAGDEFGCTKKGNNNSYCQDNDISWINWGLLKTNASLYEFTKYAIAFRWNHRVFHMKKEPALLDYRSIGLPDMSFHGVKAWCPEFDGSRRQLGVFYCGAYGVDEAGQADDYFYVAYNMHWEPREFALPNLPGRLKWHLAFDTAEEEVNGFYESGLEPLLENQKKSMVMARSIQVLIGKEDLKNDK